MGRGLNASFQVFCEKLFMNHLSYPLPWHQRCPACSSTLPSCRSFIFPSVNPFFICVWCTTWQSSVKDLVRFFWTQQAGHSVLPSLQSQVSQQRLSFSLCTEWDGSLNLGFLCSTWGRGLRSSQWLPIISRLCGCPFPRHGGTVWGTIWTWVYTTTSSFPLCFQLPWGTHRLSLGIKVDLCSDSGQENIF